MKWVLGVKSRDGIKVREKWKERMDWGMGGRRQKLSKIGWEKGERKDGLGDERKENESIKWRLGGRRNT